MNETGCGTDAPTYVLGMDPNNISKSAEQLAELAADLKNLLGQVRAETRGAARRGDARLLSMRSAAKRLGVDRGTTLRRLVDGRLIRTVVVNGRRRIPASEIERIEREGTASRVK